jgi:hypothetical protein
MAARCDPSHTMNRPRVLSGAIAWTAVTVVIIVFGVFPLLGFIVGERPLHAVVWIALVTTFVILLLRERFGAAVWCVPVAILVLLVGLD